MNQDIFLPYGMNEHQEVVHISQVESGQTSLNCPFCDTGLIAKKGPRLTHHFAHAGPTCKEVLAGELHGITRGIPFYSDFFVDDLSSSEKRSIQIFYDQFGTDMFLKKGKKGSAFQLLFQNEVPRLSQVWDRLLEARYIQQKGNWYHLSPYAEMGMALLSLAEFAEIQAQRLHFYEAFLETAEEAEDLLRRKIYENVKARLMDATLYCLHIPGIREESDAWKIGITTRSAKQRMQELIPVIVHHFGAERADATYIACEIPKMGRVEAYAKKRFVESNLPIEYKQQVYTEFFVDSKLVEELEELR